MLKENSRTMQHSKAHIYQLYNTVTEVTKAGNIVPTTGIESIFLVFPARNTRNLDSIPDTNDSTN